MSAKLQTILKIKGNLNNTNIDELVVHKILHQINSFSVFSVLQAVGADLGLFKVKTRNENVMKWEEDM